MGDEVRVLIVQPDDVTSTVTTTLRPAAPVHVAVQRPWVEPPVTTYLLDGPLVWPGVWGAMLAVDGAQVVARSKAPVKRACEIVMVLVLGEQPLGQRVAAVGLAMTGALPGATTSMSTVVAFEPAP